MPKYQSSASVCPMVIHKYKRFASKAANSLQDLMQDKGELLLRVQTLRQVQHEFRSSIGQNASCQVHIHSQLDMKPNE